MSYKNVAECYKNRISLPNSRVAYDTKNDPNLYNNSSKENYNLKSVYSKEHYITDQNPFCDMNIKKERKTYNNTVNPLVWGPSLWLFLHISSIHYDINPNKDKQNRCKQFIMSLPYLLPCIDCSEHAKFYINKIESDLDRICSNRNSLFKFYVDFHNYVNNRHNKKEFSYKEAWNMYSNGVDILSFEINK